jgi:hypothetical protein
VLLWRALAHNVVVLERAWLPHGATLAFGAAAGAAGLWLVWRGLRRDELTATVMGFAGGALIWMGWFEHGFEFMASAIGLQPLLWQGRPVLPPNLLLMYGSSFVLFALLLVLGLNKDTGCRMFLWCRRMLGMKLAPPTPGLRKDFSRIAALEYVLISWFMYAVILVLLDPRLVGPRTAGIWVAFAGLLLWSAYLVWLCATRPDQPGAALRYAIGAGGIVWLTVELGAQLRVWVEVWIRPLEMPLINAAFAVAFAVLLAGFARDSRRGQAAAA